MSEDTAVLLKLVTGGEKDHVKILCADGEVKINTFILGAISAILKDIVKSFEESNVFTGETTYNAFLFEEVKQKDLLLLFQCLFQQVPEFSPSSKLMELVQSCLFSKEKKATLNENQAEPEENMDSTSFKDDHDYLDHDQVKPVVIPIRERAKNTGDAVAIISQDNPIDEQKRSVYKCHLCHVEIYIPPPRVKGIAAKIEKEHLVSVHGFELKQCKLCKARCVDLEKHMAKSHSNFRCPICGYYAPTKKRLEIHLSKHKRIDGIRDEAMMEKVCPNCGKVLPNLKALDNHIRRACAAIDYGESICGECGKKFNHPDKLNAHIKAQHSIHKPQYICNICGKILISTTGLKSHHKAVHEIRELKCKCDICGKPCVDSNALRVHRKTHTEKKAPCPICGMKVRILKNHMDNVHTKDEDKKFQCQDCGKGFMDKIKLEYHRMNMHLKTKPYNCRYGCDISYNDMSNRNSHERKTHGKLFLIAKEEKLKEKIEMLGVDEKTFTNPIM